VVGVLGGLALFGALAIIKPIRRIGEVLLEIAHGNKDVEVPLYRARRRGGRYRTRGADNQGKLIRIEQLGNCRKETARRVAEQHRTDVQ